MPFTALTLAVLVLGEQASLQQWGGGMLIILGMVLIGYNEESKAISLQAKEDLDCTNDKLYNL